ncbi:LAETG motif-containing sortase-dependent surface protein [Streptomyces halstedii]|uniref:LAETG motif-containing sortase-dependent surface protein n=1 Tax=Streptomyces halstedii TaxID=1944 RepID=UPI0036C289DC
MQMRFRTTPAVVAATGVALALGAAAPTNAAEPEPAQRRALVVVVDFKDVHHTDTKQLKDEAKTTYFGGPQSLAGYYTKVSQGAFTYVPAVPEQVVGPYELNLNQKPCDTGAVNEAVREALKTDGYVEDKDYDSLSILQPATGGDCPWDGLGQVPGGTTWIGVGDKPEISRDLLVHEFGHNQGFSHHSRDFCAGGDLGTCAEDDYSGKTPMGGGGSEVGFAAPELISRGWLPGGQAVTVDKSATYELNSLYSGETGGVRALDIPMGNDRLVIEYRHEDPSYTLDHNLDAAVEGVHAYRVPGGDYNKSRLIDPTEGTGEGDADAITTLTDAAHGIEVKVSRSGNGSATVGVSLDGVAAPAAAEPVKNAAAPAPQALAAEGSPAPEDDTDAAAATPAANAHEAKGASQDLAATGGSSNTPLIAATGAALAAVGAASLYAVRRRNHRGA